VQGRKILLLQGLKLLPLCRLARSQSLHRLCYPGWKERPAEANTAELATPPITKQEYLLYKNKLSPIVQSLFLVSDGLDDSVLS
jgi:hypothetical protein